MDSGTPFVQLMEEKVLWEDWYTHRFSGPAVGLSPKDQRLLHMDPNELLDPSLLVYLAPSSARLSLSEQWVERRCRLATAPPEKGSAGGHAITPQAEHSHRRTLKSI